MKATLIALALLLALLPSPRRTISRSARGAWSIRHASIAAGASSSHRRTA